MIANTHETQYKEGKPIHSLAPYILCNPTLGLRASPWNGQRDRQPFVHRLGMARGPVERLGTLFVVPPDLRATPREGQKTRQASGQRLGTTTRPS